MEDSLDINVNLCRFCLDRNGVENIFDGDLDEKILYCANVKVSNDSILTQSPLIGFHFNAGY